MRKTLISILLFMILLTSCNQSKNESEKNKNDSTIQSAYKQNNQTPSQHAKEDILSMPEITDVKAVNSDKELFVAAKPKHLERFQLKSLKKKIKKQVKEENPDMKVFVSTDQKIIKKLGELESKLDDPKMNNKKIEKELKKIKAKATDEA